MGFIYRLSNMEEGAKISLNLVVHSTITNNKIPFQSQLVQQPYTGLPNTKKRNTHGSLTLRPGYLNKEVFTQGFHKLHLNLVIFPALGRRLDKSS